MWPSFYDIRKTWLFFKTVDKLGRIAQLATCLARNACLTADPGVVSSIPARSHAFVEIDHEIISKVILRPSVESFKKVTCWERADLLALVCGV